MLAPAMAARDAAMLSNEELVHLARCQRSVVALRELVLRHSPWIRRAVSYWGKAWRLRASDQEDAYQQAILAFHEALQKYEEAGNGNHEGCRFHAFLRKVVWRRFRDSIRALRRQESHLDRSVQIEDLVTGLSSGKDGPAERVMEEEWRFLVRAALGSLDPLESHLWELRESGYSLRASAAMLGISPDRAKRLRREIFKLLRRQLKDWDL